MNFVLIGFKTYMYDKAFVRVGILVFAHSIKFLRLDFSVLSQMKLFSILLTIAKVGALTCYGCEAEIFNGQLEGGSSKCFDLSNVENQEGDHLVPIYAESGSCIGKFKLDPSLNSTLLKS